MRIISAGVMASVAIALGACSGGEPEQLAFDDEATATSVEAEATETSESAPDPDAEADGLSAVIVPSEGDLAVAVSPDATAPGVSGAAAVTAAGDDEGVVGTDGVVGIAYVMVDWDGNVVEQSADIEPVLPVVVGEPTATPPRIYSVPDALASALVGQEVGTRIKVTFPAGMDDLPEYLDDAKAYALAVDIVWYQEA